MGTNRTLFCIHFGNLKGGPDEIETRTLEVMTNFNLSNSTSWIITPLITLNISGIPI